MKVTEVKCKSLMNRMGDAFFAMRYLPFRYTANPYRGCSHGCIYCYATSTHYYLRSTPDAFSTDLYAKVNSAEVLDKELRRFGKMGKKSILVIGNVSDAYQPIEARYHLTRQLLDTCLKHRYPCFVETKSPLILEDIDLLEQLGKEGLVGVGMTVTSYDDEFTRLMEPHVPRRGYPGPGKPMGRLRILTLKKLASVGVDTYLHVTPYFHSVTDKDLEQMVRDAAGAKVRSVIMAPLELTRTIRGKLVAALENTRYSDLVRLYDRLYSEDGRKLGCRVTTSEQEHLKIERRVAELCKKYDVRYWAFTNLQFNSSVRAAGIYRWGYPILTDYYELIRRNGEISLTDAVGLAKSSSVDDRYLKALRAYWESGELFKGVHGVKRVVKAGEVLYAGLDTERR